MKNELNDLNGYNPNKTNSLIMSNVENETEKLKEEAEKFTLDQVPVTLSISGYITIEKNIALCSVDEDQVKQIKEMLREGGHHQYTNVVIDDASEINPRVKLLFGRIEIKYTSTDNFDPTVLIFKKVQEICKKRKS